jgi:diketogulonate reductase-like aldo/keto reductase
VGRAVRASDIPREELFITTKVWNSEQGYDDTLRAFDRSRVKLATEYIDLYLIHWPVRGIYPETWRALEDLCRKGLARAIGVCNFKEHHLETLLGRCEIAPMVNQFELHPRLLQPGLVEYCRGRSIVVEAWAPLMRGMLAGNDLVLEISEKHRKTPAQVIIRWDLQHGFVTIPKSVHPERILENSMVFDFELTAGEMRQIDSLDRGERIGPDPDSFV